MYLWAGAVCAPTSNNNNYGLAAAVEGAGANAKIASAGSTVSVATMRGMTSVFSNARKTVASIATVAEPEVEAMPGALVAYPRMLLDAEAANAKTAYALWIHIAASTPGMTSVFNNVQMTAVVAGIMAGVEISRMAVPSQMRQVVTAVAVRTAYAIKMPSVASVPGTKPA